jgi:hypothetical protein
MGFFGILFGVCSGTEVFFGLLRLSFWKPLLHLAILSILCAIFVTFCTSFALFEDIQMAGSAIDENCGNINLTDKGIFPTIKPDSARSFHLTENATLTYQGNAPSIQSNFDHDTASRGVLWNSGLLAVWYKTDTGEFLLVPIIYSPGKITIATKPLNKDSVVSYMQKNSFPESLVQLPVKTINVPGFIGFIKFYAAGVLFFVNFMQFFFQTLFLTLIFAAIFHLFGHRNLMNLTFKDVLLLAIYAGFPGLMIASFFPAFNLPLDFSTVYIFCFAVYFICVMYRFDQRYASAQKSERTDDEDFM